MADSPSILIPRLLHVLLHLLVDRTVSSAANPEQCGLGDDFMPPILRPPDRVGAAIARWSFEGIEYAYLHLRRYRSVMELTNNM